MIYTSYRDLADCVRRNAWKVPADVDIIVGIPRSGMIPALMLAELLHKRCVDLDSFIDGRIMACGRRERIMKPCTPKKVLVLDDTVFVGTAMRKARERLANLSGKYKIIYGCIYAEGRNAKSMVDIYFQDIYRDGEDLWLYEWNILHHYPQNTKVMMLDIDGLLCKDPPDERNTTAYESYLPNAIPMILPMTPVGAIVTYRLEKYRTTTEEWLHKHGVEYGKLWMSPARSWEERKNACSPENYKARIYSEARWARLFIESNARQAEVIYRLTEKPVFCYENGILYQKN